jgi:hypothetical protein
MAAESVGNRLSASDRSRGRRGGQGGAGASAIDLAHFGQ